VAEEGEVIRIDLSDYFAGQLITYDMITKCEGVKCDVHDLVRLQPYYETVDTLYITDHSFQLIDQEPFPDSTYII